jgi:hypothetical protein
VRIHRPVVLLVVSGVLLGTPVVSEAAPAHTGVVAQSRTMAAAPAPVAPGETAGTGTRVSVRVLPAATPTPTSPPTATPTRPPANHPTTGRGGGGGKLPTTGSNSLGLFALGLGAVCLGVLMMWLASAVFRRRRESIL